MAPAKPRGGADDHKDTANAKDKAGHGHGHTNGNGHHATTNGKSRRTANSHASASATAAAAAAAAAHQQQLQLANGATNGNAEAAEAAANTPPTIQWLDFDRGVLHAYIRAYQIDVPAAFSNDIHRWLLMQPGSIGHQSPTLRRRKELRRQSKAQLANTTRKHSNNLGVQENDVIVDFLHKTRIHDVEPLLRLRRNGSNSRGREG